jgi:predicted enzyme related to lactoylglutathione lyase
MRGIGPAEVTSVKPQTQGEYIMKVVSEYPNGVFNWVDLSTSDTEAAKAFYSALFGWESVDVPTGMGTMYTMLKLDGYNVAGLGPLDPTLQEQGHAPFWSSYVKHDDVDAVAAKISEAGGTVMMPPMDVMEDGATDPTGAHFGVWQPRNHIGAQIVNQPNSLVWNELQTNDVAAAKVFYSAVFGWTNEVDQNGYVACSAGDRVQAGMMQIEESWGPVPPNWTIYFMVEDVDATAAKAQKLGGNVIVPPSPAGEIGTFSVVQDPQGGTFSVMKFNGPVSPPPGHK